LAEINDHIKNVNTKLQLLLKQYQALQHENGQLNRMVADSAIKDKAQKETIAAMKQEQLILKASIDKMDEGEKKELEKKINGYLKNIDKCISLLSHKHTE
jgi:formate-dependent nitrite reductase cytochrome c552 subunit